MTTSRTKKDSPTAVVRAAFKLINEHDTIALRALYADDAVEEVVPVGVFRGADAVIGYFRDLLAALPDLRMDPERIVGSRGTVFVKWRATGTFTGTPFNGIEPTDRAVELRGMDCLTVEDGRITEGTIVYDGAALARQIGMLPSPGSRGERAMVGAFNRFTRARRRFAAERH